MDKIGRIHIENHRLEPQKELTALAFIRLVGAVHLVPWWLGAAGSGGGFPVMHWWFPSFWVSQNGWFIRETPRIGG